MRNVRTRIELHNALGKIVNKWPHIRQALQDSQHFNNFEIHSILEDVQETAALLQDDILLHRVPCEETRKP